MTLIWIVTLFNILSEIHYSSLSMEVLPRCSEVSFTTACFYSLMHRRCCHCTAWKSFGHLHGTYQHAPGWLKRFHYWCQSHCRLPTQHYNKHEYFITIQQAARNLGLSGTSNTNSEKYGSLFLLLNKKVNKKDNCHFYLARFQDSQFWDKKL